MSVTAEEIHSLVEKYLAEYPDEAGRLARLSEALTTPGEPAGHVTSAVVLIDPQWRVLHLHDPDRHRWLLPETHLTDADRSVVGAATRELYERFGLDPDTITALPGFEVTPIDIDVRRQPANRATGRTEHWHFEVRHAFQIADTPDVQVGSEESVEPAWLAQDAVPGFTLRLKLRAIQMGLAPN
jgi:8-oxo-dGTP pyrophosphatase MutT (NUDIX family)